MDMRHKMISEKGPSENPDEVGGDNWNEPHVLGPGSMIMLGRAWFYIDPAAGFDPDQCGGTSRISNWRQPYAGGFLFDLDVTGLGFAPDTSLFIFTDIKIMRGELGAGQYINANAFINPEGGGGDISFRDDEGLFDPPEISVEVTFFLDIGPA